MASQQEVRRSKLIETINANKAASADVMAAAIDDEVYSLSQPTQTTTDLLWKVLVFALAIIAGLSLLGLVVLIALGKTPSLVLTAFTASVTGLVGLFVPAPGKAG